MQVLLTNPEVDALTRYLSAWTDKILKECRINTHKFYRLKGRKVTRKRLESMLEKNPIDLVFICGHGGSDKILGDEAEVVLDIENVGLLEGKTVHALSCHISPHYF